MDNERLIELVKSQKVLYDAEHGKYLDNNYKKNIWDAIGRELQQPGSVCKGRWNNIRDNLRKSRRKRNAPCEPGAHKPRKCKYEDLLGFLTPLLEERRLIGDPQSNQNDSKQSDFEESEVRFFKTENEESEVRFLKTENEESEVRFLKTENEDDENDTLMNNLENTNSCPNENDDELNDPLETEKSPATIDINTCVANRVETKWKRTFEMKPSRRKYIIRKNKPNKLHPVDAFLTALAPTLKTLTPYYLNLAKSKIFSAVQEYELAMLKEQSKTVEAQSPR